VLGSRAMSNLRDVLIRGSEKVIHYRLPLVCAKEKEYELYRSRIEREQKLPDELRGRVSGAARRPFPPVPSLRSRFSRLGGMGLFPGLIDEDDLRAAPSAEK